MYFVMSDIHGHYDLLEQRIEQIKPFLEKENNKLILLGDYIDRGNKSFQCLKIVYDMEQKFGSDKVIVLKGNHEVWFEEFIFENEDIWLEEDRNYQTSKTFLTEEQLKELKYLPNRILKIDYVKKCIKDNHKSLLDWMKKLRLFYETDNQIFVHVGVDETIPEEELEWCTIGTPDYILTGKYPPTIGYFYKDVIAGHVAASLVARDRKFKGIYFDGKSHFYIDGSVGKNRKILCLAYDEITNKYYEFKEDNSFCEIIQKINNL